MKKMLFVFLCLMLILAACDSQSAIQPSADSATQNADATIVTTVPVETEPETVPTTVPPTDPKKPSLGIDAGAYLMSYSDEFSGVYMDYYLFVPNNATIDMPLVVFLHGINEVGRPELLENYGIVNCVKGIYGDDFPFLLLLPSTHIQSWIVYDVPYTLYDLVESVARTYESDRNHIIITGHSLGAIGTWKSVSLYGNFYSCAVPVSCGIDDVLDYDNFLNVPVWGFVGTSGDAEQRYNNAMHRIASTINAAGGNVELTVFEGATHTDTATLPYTQELFDWMLAQ